MGRVSSISGSTEDEVSYWHVIPSTGLSCPETPTLVRISNGEFVIGMVLANSRGMLG
ncbi:hypothetical protein CALCODRAFT_498604 [Calocera cornea HHB12733]|uniref:Uncharacterized protein n=1 Tax=Calocera cornea HHB12733 TaxID=1353952 RepID=A0A165ETB0_9BASI|nr:hypothetical protein CALCODRAFT_498604 [Calocera cornea HHB12733]